MTHRRLQHHHDEQRRHRDRHGEYVRPGLAVDDAGHGQRPEHVHPDPRRRYAHRQYGHRRHRCDDQPLHPGQRRYGDRLRTRRPERPAAEHHSQQQHDGTADGEFRNRQPQPGPPLVRGEQQHRQADQDGRRHRRRDQDGEPGGEHRDGDTPRAQMSSVEHQYGDTERGRRHRAPGDASGQQGRRDRRHPHHQYGRRPGEPAEPDLPRDQPRRQQDQARDHHGGFPYGAQPGRVPFQPVRQPHPHRQRYVHQPVRHRHLVRLGHDPEQTDHPRDPPRLTGVAARGVRGGGKAAYGVPGDEQFGAEREPSHGGGVADWGV